MKLGAIAFVCALSLSTAVFAGEAGSLVLPDFQVLQRQATNSVNISLDPWLLRSMAAFIGDTDADSVATKKMLSGIKSIQIRSFNFGADFEYPTAAVDGIRQQLTGPGWAKMVQVHDHKQREDVDIYLLMDQHRANGFALIASDSRQLTIINIVGSIDMNDLPTLERQFHIPSLGFPTAGI
jgi:uncharacterized protein DUF4252